MLPRVMNARRFKRSVTAAAIGLLSIFALSGCVKMDIALSVEGDNVNGTMIVGVDKQILELSGQSEDELVDQLTEDVPDTEGVTTEPYEDDTFIGTRFTLDDVSLDEFNNEGSTASDDLQITHDAGAGQYKVSGVLDLSEAAGEGAAELTENLDIKIAITFPGRVISHNGELDGTTVTWRPKAGEKLTIQATASDDASSFNWLLVVGIAVPILLLLAGLVVWFFLRGRSSGGTPAPAEPAPAGYPGGAAYPSGLRRPDIPWRRTHRAAVPGPPGVAPGSASPGLAHATAHRARLAEPANRGHRQSRSRPRGSCPRFSRPATPAPPTRPRCGVVRRRVLWHA